MDKTIQRIYNKIQFYKKTKYKIIVRYYSLETEKKYIFINIKNINRRDIEYINFIDINAAKEIN